MRYEVECRIEARHGEPDYQGKTFAPGEVEAARHRTFVGGLWEEMGRHQLDWLRAQGLRPEERFLDVGCGALRAGRFLAGYLDPGNYYGIDVNKDLIELGYGRELDDATRARLPITNLRMTDRFDADFGVRFDRAIAQSLFTHLNLNQIRLCLYRLATVVRPGGKFYATFGERVRSYPLDGTDKTRRYSERNVFWYYRSDMRWVAGFSPWDFEYVGDWGHPRGQKMVVYTRRPDGPGDGA